MEEAAVFHAGPAHFAEPALCLGRASRIQARVQYARVPYPIREGIPALISRRKAAMIP
jgi:hypothetical protein